VPFCKSGQKQKSGYILAGAGFVKMAGFRPKPKSSTALVYVVKWKRWYFALPHSTAWTHLSVRRDFYCITGEV